MTAILHKALIVAVAVAMVTCPLAIPLAMITMRKSILGFPLLSYVGMGLRLAALQAISDGHWCTLFSQTNL